MKHMNYYDKMHVQPMCISWEKKNHKMHKRPKSRISWSFEVNTKSKVMEKSYTVHS